MTIDYKNYSKELKAQEKNITKDISIEKEIFNEYVVKLHNMKREEMSKIIDEVFCQPDLECLLNYEKELYGTRNNN